MASHFIAGDWGTTSLRLYLIDAVSFQTLAEIQGPGIAQTNKVEIPVILSQLTTKWRDQYKVGYIILCGMVGSTLGWIDAGYCQCPLELQALSRQLAYLTLDNTAIYIIAGVQCKNLLGGYDVMRGEETQLLGAFESGSLNQNKSLICLSGTHSKWVQANQTTINSFITSLSGELFATLSKHSILTKHTQSAKDRESFMLGVDRAFHNSAVDLLYLLFETRSGQLREPKLNCPHSFLSGLIIGRDIDHASKLFNLSNNQTITFIGEQQLTDWYQLAAEQMSINNQTIDGSLMSKAGLIAIYQSLSSGRAQSD